MKEILHSPNAIWIFSLLFALVGMLLGWWLRTVTHGKALREEYELRDQERMHLAAMNTQIREAHDLKEADLKKAKLEIEELRTRNGAFEQEKNLHLSAVQSSAARIQTVQTELAGQIAKAQAYEEQILGLRTRNAYLTGEINRLREENSAWKNLHHDFHSMQKNTEALEEAIAQIEQERNLVQHELDAAYLEIENLQTELVDAKFHASANGHDTAVAARFAAAPAPPDTEQDDLKIINGISPFSEIKLREAGVRTFAEISAWTEDKMQEINELLGFSAGRIQKENWVGQAKHLLAAQLDAV